MSARDDLLSMDDHYADQMRTDQCLGFLTIVARQMQSFVDGEPRRPCTVIVGKERSVE